MSEHGDFYHVGNDKSENDDIDHLSTSLLAEKIIQIFIIFDH